MSSIRLQDDGSKSIDARLANVTGSEIRQNAWCQGAIVGGGMAKIIAARARCHIDENSLLVVASHDCDVVSMNLEVEPVVELLHARIVERIDGNLTRGKNPRVIQVSVSIDGHERDLEMRAHERFFVDRRILGLEAPSAFLGEGQRRQVRRWLAARYVRAAFPDQFNERIRPAIGVVRKLFSKSGEALSAIFLYVRDEELPTDEAYKIELIATMDVDTYARSAARKDCESVIGKVTVALDQCEGIEVCETEVRSEAELSLDDLGVLKRWDWEHLSLKSEPPASRAPHP